MFPRCSKIKFNCQHTLLSTEVRNFVTFYIKKQVENRLVHYIHGSQVYNNNNNNNNQLYLMRVDT